MRDSSSLTGAFPALRTAEPLSQGSMWRSIRYFNAYRLTQGGVLLLLGLLFGEVLSPNQAERAFFVWIGAAYIFLVLVSSVLFMRRWPRPSLQLAFQVCVDVACIAGMTYFGGGIQSNLGMLLLVSLAWAGMISRGRITLLYAALAAIAILLEHSYAVLARDASAALFFQAGTLSAAYFAVAWLSHTLSKYAIANEKLAFLRGVDLSNMAEANRLMIQDMQDGVLVVDERSVVRQSNPSAERLLGYSFPQRGKILLADCSPVLDALFSAWRQNRALGREVLHLPGTNHPVRVRFLPVQRESFWGAVVVLEDVRRVQEQAQQDKLAALGRLTANIAHEVRNPLSSISYANELLQEQGGDAAQVRLFQIIKDNAARLNRIVEDVMQINRRDRAQAEPLNLVSRLEELVNNLCQVEQLPPSVFELKIAPGSIVYFDRGHFEQVLWNLCRNALRYSQRKTGSVRLVAWRGEDGRMVLEVLDDGAGIPPDAQQKLFEPFFTTSSGGTGLGLYIARELCEANGAMISYRANPEGGSCFRIVFGGGNES